MTGIAKLRGAKLNKEVRILKQIDHVHVVRLVTSYEFSDNYAIILDPLADGNLEDYLSASAPESTEKIPRWFRCLLSGVSFAHDQGVRHRDIKPQNILVKNMDVLLTDFGISMMGLGITVPTTVMGDLAREPWNIALLRCNQATLAADRPIYSP